MDIKPVRSIDRPKYPPKEELTAQRLKDSLPKRWAASKAAKAALGALAAVTLAGCNTQPPTAGVPMPPASSTEGSILSQQPELSIFAGVPMPASLNVAPLFVHGEGRGAFGCVMVAPPVFLSEEDALAVINETAKEYGLEFSAKNPPEFASVLQPVTNMYPAGQMISGSPEKTEGAAEYITLKTDFSDEAHNIAIEYVSTQDVTNWNIGKQYVSGGTYETRDAADQLSDALERAYPVNGEQYAAGVLYDPCEQYRPGGQPIMSEESRKEAETKSRSMSEAQIAAQAKDFFEWLRVQGVI